jgi:Mn-dependent DtxR family transcriptional regulator
MREEGFAVGKQTPLTEMELRILVAVEETRGDHWKIADALKDSGLLKSQRAGLRKALEPLEKSGFVERVGDESYRLTGEGRHAARAAIERSRAWLDHATKILG